MGPKRRVNSALKTFQCVVYMEERGHLLVFIVSQQKTSTAVQIEGFERLIVLEDANEYEIDPHCCETRPRSAMR
jgi:hypothetical protein